MRTDESQRDLASRYFFLQGIAGGVWWLAVFLSPLVTFWIGFFAVVGAIAWNIVIRPVEEGDLFDRFGEPYRKYCNEVECWIPSMRNLQRKGRETLYE